MDSVLEPVVRALLVWCLFVGALVTLGVVAWVVREAWPKKGGSGRIRWYNRLAVALHEPIAGSLAELAMPVWQQQAEEDLWREIEEPQWVGEAIHEAYNEGYRDAERDLSDPDERPW